MATIEPRLIHLLNDSKSSGYFPPNELPPLQPFSYSKSSGHAVSLPPLGLELNPRGDQQLVQSHAAHAHVHLHSQKPPPASQQIPSLSSVTGEECRYDGSARLKKANHSLRVLLDDTDSTTSIPTTTATPPSTTNNNKTNNNSNTRITTTTTEYCHSLRMILGDNPADISAEDLSNKKRQRALTVKDDFVQLPQPLKKQKSAQKVMPPIINGLHNPPHNAAVFPPMSAVDFDTRESLGINPLKEYNSNPIPDDKHDQQAPLTPVEEPSAPGKGKVAPKRRVRTAKPRRKWTEVETNHLLLGVSRHGVGKWTSILEDPDFQFNDRTAGDLKDRFRTCCPDELRASSVNHTGSKPATSPSDPKPKSGRSIMLETVLIGSEEAEPEIAPSFYVPDPNPVAKSMRRSRAHRKNLEDLAELGIHGPFKKSLRRERKPFTEQDDKEILAGIHKYGPAWTKIQRDETFNLSSRQPTDLRDRVRNKYPDIYARIEKGGFQLKDPLASNIEKGSGLRAKEHPMNNYTTLEPIVSTTIERSLHSGKPGPLERQLNRTGSKENIPRWPHHGVVAESYDPNEPSTSSLMGTAGEMDISRLLLDDSRTAADS